MKKAVAITYVLILLFLMTACTTQKTNISENSIVGLENIEENITNSKRSSILKSVEFKSSDGGPSSFINIENTGNIITAKCGKNVEFLIKYDETTKTAFVAGDGAEHQNIDENFTYKIKYNEEDKIVEFHLEDGIYSELIYEASDKIKVIEHYEKYNISNSHCLSEGSMHITTSHSLATVVKVVRV